MKKDMVIRLCDNCEGIIEKKDQQITLKIIGDRGEFCGIQLSFEKNGIYAIEFYDDLHFCCRDCFFEYLSSTIDSLEEGSDGKFLGY